MRVYISGPITGIDRDEAVKAFARAEIYVRILADDPLVEMINPLKVGRVLEQNANLRHEDYMKISFALMDICDTVYFMSGWESSKGCAEEWIYAQNTNMRIIEHDKEWRVEK